MNLSGGIFSALPQLYKLDSVLLEGDSISLKTNYLIEGRKSKEYTITLEEADEFLKYIIKPLSINADYLKGFMSFSLGDRLETYKKHNKHIIWEQ